MPPSPIIFHFNNSEWRQTQKSVMRNIKRIARRSSNFGSVGAVPDLDIITCNSHTLPTLTQKWLTEMGVPFYWLGRGDPQWVNIHKILLCNDFLQSAQSRYVMHLDANDVLTSTSLSGVVDRFLSHHCDLLFNAEAYFFYHEAPGFETGRYAALGHKIREHQASQYSLLAARRMSSLCRCAKHIACQANQSHDGIWRGGFTYLNSGCWIGKTSFLRSAFAMLVEMLHVVGSFKNDQPYMHILHHSCYPQVKIDNCCSIFQCGTLCHPYDFFINREPMSTHL